MHNDEDHAPDYDWFQPDITNPDPAEEVLACTICGHVKWTAREIQTLTLGDLLVTKV